MVSLLLDGLHQLIMREVLGSNPANCRIILLLLLYIRYNLTYNLFSMQVQKFLTLIDEIIREKISDLHITPNDYPYIRDKVGDIVPVESFGKLGDDDIKDICTLLLSRDFTEKTIDLSFEYKNTRFRVNISRILR